MLFTFFTFSGIFSFIFITDFYCLSPQIYEFSLSPMADKRNFFAPTILFPLSAAEEQKEKSLHAKTSQTSRKIHHTRQNFFRN
jgi:hypothetical protein